VRSRLELVPVETMEDVFAVALHRVIVPQRVAGDFVIEVDDDTTIEDEDEQEPVRRSARGRRRSS